MKHDTAKRDTAKRGIASPIGQPRRSADVVRDEVHKRLVKLSVPGLTVSVDNRQPAQFSKPRTWCKECKAVRLLGHEALLWLDGLYTNEPKLRVADFAEFIEDVESVVNQSCKRPGCILLRHALRPVTVCGGGTYATWEDTCKEVRAALYLCEGGESEQSPIQLTATGRAPFSRST